MTDRYQSAPGLPGTFDTPRWFRALRDGIDGPLGSVLDVGCAEGVMCALALDDGATAVQGIDHNAERIAIARAQVPGASFLDMNAADILTPRFRTVILSQIIHWLGADLSRRYFGAAERNLAIVFRPANDHYAIPENGTWFPTFEELDAAVGGVRTSEMLLETQDRGKTIWAATYRTDLQVRDGWVRKTGVGLRGLAALVAAGAPLEVEFDLGAVWMPLYSGLDLHGDRPFRPRPDRPVLHHPSVNALASGIARAAIASGFVPLDFSPRNVIITDDGARLVDLGEIERHDGTIPEEYRVVWERTLGRPFSGRLADLV